MHIHISAPRLTIELCRKMTKNMRDKLKLQNFTINKIQKTQNEGRKEEIGKKSNNKPGKMTLKFRPTKLRYIRMA